jgi:hypothetical protein
MFFHVFVFFQTPSTNKNHRPLTKISRYSHIRYESCLLGRWASQTEVTIKNEIITSSTMVGAVGHPPNAQLEYHRFPPGP